jgi:subtilisin family serine protease
VPDVRSVAVAGRFGGTLLDPAHQAVSRAGAGPMGVTAFRTGRLLLHTTDPALRGRLLAALDLPGTAVDDDDLTCRVATPGRDEQDLLDEIRRLEPDLAALVGLDHLLTTAEQVGGNPFALGHGQPGLDRYGLAGAGRGPVSMPLAGPDLRTPAGFRPRVVVLDTGVGRHPWLPADDVSGTIRFADGTVLAAVVDRAEIAEPDADGAGMIPDRLLGALGSHSGHGTFIAGLLRQRCPQARIVAPEIMGADGVVPESTLVTGLRAVLRKQREEPGWADAVVLSLGFYAETGDDLAYTSGLLHLLAEIGRAGIATFCAAGNDATSRPSFPAAFAVAEEFTDPATVPLVSVAAANPDGTVAAFSNDGRWVLAQAPGVNMVSAVPVDAAGSARPRRSLPGIGGRRRSATDPDDFDSGFASWSGTSFAAPMVAGDFLAALVRAGGHADVAERRAIIGGLLRRQVVPR